MNCDTIYSELSVLEDTVTDAMRLHVNTIIPNDSSMFSSGDWIAIAAILASLIVLFIQEYYNRRSQRRERQTSWFLSVVVEPKMQNIEEYFRGMLGCVIETVQHLQDGRSNPIKTKSKANLRFTTMSSHIKGEVCLLIKSYDTKLAKAASRIIEDTQDLCSNIIDSNNKENDEIELSIMEMRSKFVANLYKTVRG